MVSPAAAGFMLSAQWDPASVFYAMAAPMVLSCLALIAFDRLTSNVGASIDADAAEET
jgi:hypothetical protein